MGWILSPYLLANCWIPFAEPSCSCSRQRKIRLNERWKTYNGTRVCKILTCVVFTLERWKGFFLVFFDFQETLAGIFDMCFDCTPSMQSPCSNLQWQITRGNISHIFFDILIVMLFRMAYPVPSAAHN